MSSVDAELALVALGAMLAPVNLLLTVLVLVLGKRPLRTGLWFYFGAVTATIVIGVIAAFVLGNSAASPRPNTPKTWVAIVDVVAGAAALGYVIRLLRRPRDPARVQRMIGQMSKVASSPAIAIVAAGATLINPGAFMPLALKDISQTNPTTGQYILEWIAFTLLALLPLSLALIALAVAPARTQHALGGAREWLERNARTIAAVVIVLLAGVLLRNGVAGLTG